MKLQKLALASAIAMAPTLGYSMTEMEDELLSDVAGQDGIEMVFAPPAGGIAADIYIHDKDGLGAVPISPGYSFDGAIVVEGFSYSGTMTIQIDAGDSVATGPVLNINVNIPSATIVTGSIKVANSERDNSAWGVTNLSGPLIDSMTIALAGLSVNMQLGNEPQGSMVAINSTITGGLTINNLGLHGFVWVTFSA